ncbi:unnamed protein product [Phaedon cochleariae]|uniref:Spaetzle domain-containing protein n=1 Tax=Phaedon cochleariae TaxID=80249 RepID=A0A9P0DLM3_PHACE|nr:unnamed protein product [Phaedon cochleariae]
MTVANEDPLNMDTKITICAVLCTFLFLIDKCEPLTKTIMKKKFIPKKTSCDSDHLCTQTEFYPTRAINKMISSKKNKNKFAHLRGNVIEPTNDVISVNARSPEDFADKNMCQTRRTSKIPMVAFDTKKRQKFIVNTKSYQQIVIYETCKEPEGPCYGNDSLPYDIQTFCKQAYSIVRLVSVSHTGQLEYGYFPVPSNCVCSYKTTNILDHT